jgi:type IV pilus assembly protein PilO
MAIMNDFARLPNQRKVLLFVVIGVLSFGLYYQFGLSKLSSDLSEEESLNESRIAQSRKADNDIKELDDLKPTLNRLKAQIDQNEKALPSESELPAFFETLNRKVTESGVQVNRSTQKPEEPIESFIKVPVDFEISGTFMQIKRFFASLVPKRARAGAAPPANGEQGVEERERIVSIENLTISDPTVKNREIVLTAKFTATTYRQEERVEPAAAKPGAPTNGSAPTAPTKPLPPAATPAGAKARVNNAMDKDEQRSTGSAAKLKGGI